MSALLGVVFDLDDTLTDHRGLEAEIWQEIAELVGSRLHGVDQGQLRRRYAANREPLYARHLAGELDEDAFQRARLTDAVAPWGTPDDELVDGYLALKQRLNHGTRPAPGAAQALQDVGDAGMRIGVLTNGFTEFQRSKLRRIGFDGEVDAFVASEEVGAEKPDLAAFVAVANALGARPEELAMVGDNLVNDVTGAIDAGFAAAVLITHGAPLPEELPAGAHAVARVGDAPGCLRLGERA